MGYFGSYSLKWGDGWPRAKGRICYCSNQVHEISSRELELRLTGNRQQNPIHSNLRLLKDRNYPKKQHKATNLEDVLTIRKF